MNAVPCDATQDIHPQHYQHETHRQFQPLGKTLGDHPIQQQYHSTEHEQCQGVAQARSRPPGAVSASAKTIARCSGSQSGVSLRQRPS